MTPARPFTTLEPWMAFAVQKAPTPERTISAMT